MCHSIELAKKSSVRIVTVNKNGRRERLKTSRCPVCSGTPHGWVAADVYLYFNNIFRCTGIPALWIESSKFEQPDGYSVLIQLPGIITSGKNAYFIPVKENLINLAFRQIDVKDRQADGYKL